MSIGVEVAKCLSEYSTKYLSNVPAKSIGESPAKLTVSLRLISQ